MKTRLLKNFRQRFKFTDVHGYNQMLDIKTGVIYGPEWSYCHSTRSVKEHNIRIALEILGAGNRFTEMDRKKRMRRQRFLKNKTFLSAMQN